MKKILVAYLSVVVLLLSACNSDHSENDVAKTEVPLQQTELDNDEGTEKEIEVPKIPEELSAKDEMIAKVAGMVGNGFVFDSGSYIKGDIPKGEYAFVTFNGSGSYYSEEDPEGNIIDNENFSSFGYVQVHEVGNIDNGGVLVENESLAKLGVKGAKELYEILNEKEDYLESGLYKVGVDIEPGEYIFESDDSGYIAVLT